MNHGFALIKNNFRITAGQKIVKAADYRSRVEADKLIDTAHRAAEHIRAEADRRYRATLSKCDDMREATDKAYHNAVEKGYDEGFAAAQSDYAAKINDVLIDRAEIIDQVENSLVDMLMTGLKTIISSDIGSEQTIRGIAVQALRKAGRVQYAKLRVHPDRVEGVQNAILNIKKEFEGLEWIEVVADAKLQPEDCLLHTPVGVLDFSLETQLRVLEEYLRARVRKAGGS